MKRTVIVFVGLVILGGVASSAARKPIATGSHYQQWQAKPTAALPASAAQVVQTFLGKQRQLHRRLEQQVAPHRRRALKQLKALQDRYCRQAKLDQALAIRRAIRQLSGVQPDPGYVSARREDIGRSFLYEVVGTSSGSVWGTQVYTTDSHLAAAAVHAGVLTVGQKGVVRVRILPGQPAYQGSSQNGVTTRPYGSWGLSFTVGPR